MTTIKTISRWILAVLMVFAGVMHFIRPNFFLKIMPPYLPLHLELVYLSGVFEIGLGICLLIPRFSRICGLGHHCLVDRRFPCKHLPLPASGNCPGIADRTPSAPFIPRHTDLPGVLAHVKSDSIAHQVVRQNVDKTRSR